MGGKYSRAETIRGNTVYVKIGIRLQTHFDSTIPARPNCSAFELESQCKNRRNTFTVKLENVILTIFFFLPETK